MTEEDYRIDQHHRTLYGEADEYGGTGGLVREMSLFKEWKAMIDKERLSVKIAVIAFALGLGANLAGLGYLISLMAP